MEKLKSIFWTGEIMAIIIAIVGVITDFIRYHQPVIQLICGIFVGPLVLTVFWCFFFCVGWCDEF